MIRLSAIGLVSLVAFLLFPQIALADYKGDMGFASLRAELSDSMPAGENVAVTQAEARTSYGDPLGPFMPNTADGQFSGKTIVKKTADAVSGSSGHATRVGQLFYGSTSSLSPGIKSIDVYEADHFIRSGFLHHGSVYQPGETFSSSDRSSSSRVANHSWVGGTIPAETTSDMLRRLDFLVETDEFIQVVAPDNGTSGKPLLISAFNSISVGRSDGGHQRGAVFVDPDYAAESVKPDVVVPSSPTSYAAPLGASAAVILVQTGKNPSLSTDLVQKFTFNRDQEKIYNGERSEVVKAAMMAGAERVTRNTALTDVVGYRVDSANRSANGLDVRFGAGQVNLHHSYHIIAAGEQNSAEDVPTGRGIIGWYGFDYDPFFGGKDGSNLAATYTFTADRDHRMLYASLVWNIDIDGGAWNSFNNAATLYNLALSLYEVIDPENPRLLGRSDGTGDNTENLWMPLVSGRRYELRVTSGQGQAPFNWDYALAWRMATPPDSDGDTGPDDWEVYYGLNHLDAGDGALDSDGDGLSNAQEYQVGTDPKNQDTDADGAVDGIDRCPGDPLKVSSGSCGCGAPETDADRDGIEDCIDQFPDTPIEKGDINNDGGVNLFDGIIGLQALAGISRHASFSEADTNGDGKIGIGDVIYLLQKLAGIR